MKAQPSKSYAFGVQSPLPREIQLKMTAPVDERVAAGPFQEGK